MTEKSRRTPSKDRSGRIPPERDATLRDRIAELEQQVAALRFAAEQGDLVREQFADLYDYAPVGYLTVDGEGTIRRVNVPAAALLGGSRQDLANRKLVTLVRPDDKARFMAFVRGAFTATTPVSVEVGLVRGKWRAEHLQFVAAPAALGRDLGHAGPQARLAVLDVTDRWRAEEALRESRDRFQAVVASMAEGVVVHDAGGAIRECNAAAQRILGLSEDELLGRRSVDPRWRAVREDGTPFPGEEHPAMEVLRTGGSRWNVLMGVHRPDGTLAWLRVNADPLRNADGSVRGAVATFSDVTQRWEMEKALAASERRFRDLVTGMRDGLVVMQDGAAVFANPAMARLHGFEDPSALRGLAAREFVDAASQSAIDETNRRIHAGEPAIPIDLRITSKDGAVRIAEALASLVSFDGRPAIQVVLRDVTETRRLRATLDRTVRELRHHVENTPLALVEWDGDYRVSRFSAQAEATFGWREDEIVGRRIDEVPWLPEEDWAHVRALMTEMDSGARPVNVSANRNRRKDGRIIHCEWFNSCHYDAAGRLTSVFSLVQDVTARVEAEEALKASEARLSLLIEHAPASVAMFDREMRILAASQRWVETHDLAGRDFVGRVLYDLHPGIPERWREAHRRGLAGESQRAEEDAAVPGRPGDEVVRWEVQPWRSARGEVGGIVIFSEIVTEQRALQARLVASSKLEALGTLVGGMAHEINNPLAAEMAGAGVAADLVREARERIAAGMGAPGEGPIALLDEALDALREARESSQRIGAIVRDLVKFGRQDRGTERLRLRAVVDDAMRWLASPRHAGVEIRVEDAGAPDVAGVESQILQVVVALLTNARQSIPAGRGGVVAVRLGPGGAGTSRVDVEDDGEGMTAEVLSRAFDPFFTTRGVGQGIGLGLSVAHAIATAHGGTLTATSRPGAGSTFRLELPAAGPPEGGDVVTPG